MFDNIVTYVMFISSNICNIMFTWCSAQTVIACLLTSSKKECQNSGRVLAFQLKSNRLAVCSSYNHNYKYLFISNFCNTHNQSAMLLHVCALKVYLHTLIAIIVGIYPICGIFIHTRRLYSFVR